MTPSLEVSDDAPAKASESTYVMDGRGIQDNGLDVEPEVDYVIKSVEDSGMTTKVGNDDPDENSLIYVSVLLVDISVN